MRDDGKRAAVRKMLRLKKWQGESDRTVAKEAGVSNYLVGSVRRELIAAGHHPTPEPSKTTGEVLAGRMYKPGTSARGGYVYDERGRTVRETVWLARQRKARQR